MYGLNFKVSEVPLVGRITHRHVVNSWGEASKLRIFKSAIFK